MSMHGHVYSAVYCLLHSCLFMWALYCRDNVGQSANILLQVKEGDTVLYFKYAGESMETPEGQQYIVVHEQDVLCKC